MSEHPSPYRLRKAFRRVDATVLEGILKNYATAYSLSIRQGQGARSNIKITGHTDPTGDVVADKELMRRRLARIGSNLVEAASLLNGADEALAVLLGHKGDDPVRHRAGEVVDPEQVDDAMRYLHRQTRRHTNRRNS